MTRDRLPLGAAFRALCPRKALCGWCVDLSSHEAFPGAWIFQLCPQDLPLVPGQS